MKRASCLAVSFLFVLSAGLLFAQEPGGHMQSVFPRFLADLINPNLAYVLLVIGIIGIAVELSMPGIGLPGIIGGLSLLIALVALGALSVNFVGVLIILFSLVLFVVDVKAPTHGILTAGGIVALLVGSFLLFPSNPPFSARTRISPLLIGAMTVLLGGVLTAVVAIGAKAQRRKITVGSETLVGQPGVALTDVGSTGTVRVANEEWSATSIGDEIKKGDEIDVVDVKGVHLVVMRKL
jgi:membrane-bound serine protease (ClpP class)